MKLKFLISNKLKSKFVKIFWITIAWIIVALFQFAIGYAVVTQLNCELEGYVPYIYFRGSLLTGVVAGLIGGGGVVFLWEGWLRSKNYATALFNIFYSYCIIYFIVAVVSSSYFHFQETNLPFFSTE